MEIEELRIFSYFPLSPSLYLSLLDSLQQIFYKIHLSSSFINNNLLDMYHV